jgi:RNA polymerase sigma-70 factor (ECF subfamily)
MSSTKPNETPLDAPITDTIESEQVLPKMTEQFFANAYQRGFQQTVRFLLSRGISRDFVFDTAQGAWTRAWERREQLRNPAFILTWVNSIAINVYRTTLRREPQTEELLDIQGVSRDMDGTTIDVERILSECKPSDRIVLEDHYIRGYKLEEIAAQNNWSETAVRIRLLRARRKMRHIFVRPKKVHFLNKNRVSRTGAMSHPAQRKAA